MKENYDDALASTPEEIRNIAVAVTHNLLPDKSRKLYNRSYSNLMEWQMKKQACYFSENVLLAYFQEISVKFVSSTLWGEYSMIKSTFNISEKVDISKYTQLHAFLKRKSEGFKLKKTRTFSPSELNSFINEAPDEVYLLIKVHVTRNTQPIHNLNSQSTDWLCERAIFTPKNDLSFVKVIRRGRIRVLIRRQVYMDDAVHYPVEFLNSINSPGLTRHTLTIKVGAPVMLLRNLNPPKLCNGIRLRVKALHKNVVEAITFTGCARGESVFIPRIPLIPINRVYPFEFKRLQFPLKICFAMTINKDQGQSLKTAGIDLRGNCFSHGQFNVACSWVSSPSNLVMLAHEGRTCNVVYNE